MPTSLCPGPAGRWAFSQKHEHFYRQISHQLIKAYGALPTLHKIVCNAWLLCHLSGFPLPNSLSSSWYLENPIPIINCGPSDLGELFRLGGYDSQLDTQWYSHTRVWNYILGIKTNTFFPPLCQMGEIWHLWTLSVQIFDSSSTLSPSWAKTCPHNLGSLCLAEDVAAGSRKLESICQQSGVKESWQSLVYSNPEAGPECPYGILRSACPGVRVHLLHHQDPVQNGAPLQGPEKLYAWPHGSGFLPWSQSKDTIHHSARMCMCVERVLPEGGILSGLPVLSSQSLSHVWLFVTPGTVTHQAPLPMEFSRKDYSSGMPFPFLG